VSTALQASWGTGALAPSNSSDVVGAFRFICGAGQLSYDDPIMYPGQSGKSHLHQYYGNTSADANSTFASLRGAGASTCNNVGTATAANRSAYWMPAMLDGKGHVIQPDYIQVYYKREPVNAPQCNPGDPKFVGICVGIPNGVKFIAGFNMATGNPGSQPGWFRCGSGPVWSADGVGLSQANSTNCAVGKKLEVTVASLKCWNGQLDSSDHVNHFAFTVRNALTGWVNKCPSTHPYLTPQFTISAFYSIKTGDNVGVWTLSSDSMYGNLPRGSTLHFDYFEAWDTLVKDMWVDNCIGKKLNCSGGDLGNGKQLIGASQPKYGWSNPTHLVGVGPRAAS